MSIKKSKGSGLKDNTMVYIKPAAYFKMKAHVLRFGSKAKSRDEYKEVMGMLMGRLVDGKNPNIKDVIVEDAVPISHGGKVEVAFSPEDYVNFSIVDSQFAEKGMFNVGWYHSHPGLTCFFSAVDIRNQLGFQSANPSAIGIVFDHERFQNEDDMGFDVYRLDDPSQGQMSDYHEVDWMLDAPETDEFYTEWIRGLIESYQKGEPPILELSETPDVFGDLTLPGRNSMMAKEPELNFSKISETLNKGFADFTYAFFQPLILYLNEWASSISKGLIDKNIKILEVVLQLKNGLSKAIGGLQSWFKFQINDRLRDVDILIDDQLEMLTNQQTKLKSDLQAMKDGVKEQIGAAFTKAMGDTLTKLTDDLDNALSQFANALQQSQSFEEKISQQSALVSKADQALSAGVAQMKKQTDQLLNNLDLQMTTSIGGLGKEVEEILEQQHDLLDSLKALRTLANSL